MTRRTFLLASLAASLSATLSACGFHPRGEQSLPPALRQVSLQGSQESGLTQALRQLLQQSGASLFTSANLPADGIHIRLSEIQLQRREALIDRQANVRQIEFILRVRLDAKHADGRVLLDNERFEAIKSTSYNPLSLLAQGEEEQRVRNDLDEQLAHSLLARLRASLGTSLGARVAAA